MKNGFVCVLLANGFEEIEAVTIIDVLRRAELEVRVTGIDGSGNSVDGAHGLTVAVDGDIGSIDPDDVAMTVLPGGMPGSVNLRDSRPVKELLRRSYEAGAITAAICAAPIALHAAGLLDGRRATSYPSFADHLVGVDYSEQKVEIDGRIVTSRGPGTALEFALALVEQAGKPETAVALRQGMLVS